MTANTNSYIRHCYKLSQDLFHSFLLSFYILKFRSRERIRNLHLCLSLGRELPHCSAGWVLLLSSLHLLRWTVTNPRGTSRGKAAGNAVEETWENHRRYSHSPDWNLPKSDYTCSCIPIGQGSHEEANFNSTYDLTAQMVQGRRAIMK